MQTTIDLVPNPEQTAFVKLKSLRIKNIRNYGDVTVPLDDQGIVSILGPNGVGKSTMWDALEVAFYSSTPKGHVRDELTKNQKDALIEVVVQVGKKLNKIEYKRVRKKWAHYIEYWDEPNGKWEPEGQHGATEAAKAAAVLLGFSKKEFEGAIHLTQAGQHVLIEGKPKERKEYIAKFFGIDDRYDLLLAEAKTELEKVETELEKYPGYLQSKDMLQQELSGMTKVDLGPIEKEVASLSESYHAASRNVSQWQNIHQSALSYEALAQVALSIPDVENLHQTKQSEILNLRNDLKNIEQKSELVKRAKQIQVKIFQLEDQVSQCGAVDPNFNDNGQIASLRDRQSKEQTLGQYNAELQALIGVDFSSVDTLVQDQVDIENFRIRHRDLSNKTKAIQGGVCPTCGAKHESQVLEDDKLEMTVLDKKIQGLIASISTKSALKSRRDRKDQLVQFLQGYQPFTQENSEQLKTLLETQKVSAQKASFLKDLEFTKTTLPVVDSYEILDTTTLLATLSRLELEYPEIQRVYQAKMRLPAKPETTSEEAKKNSEYWSGQATQCGVQLSEKEKIKMQTHTNNVQFDRLEKQIKDIEQLLVRHDALKKDEFFWQKVVEAYGPKGLRVNQLKSIMELVMKTLPHYASILFEEKGMIFNHNCDADNIEITVERGPANERYTYDISAFSGGEMRRMSLVFMLTLADCVTAKKKSNILILDEVDAHLDAYGKNIFINELLPKLKRGFSSIFVISHDTEIQQAAVYDQAWYVEKKNHVSSVKMLTLS